MVLPLGENHLNINIVIAYLMKKFKSPEVLDIFFKQDSIL